MILSCPSKTFLCGEYGVLEGGKALVLSHEPRFQLFVTEATSPQDFPRWLHPESPSGLYYKQNRHFFESYELKFEDPHQGAGGFGASGAQFLTLFSVKNKDASLAEVISAFKSLDASDSSGSDLISQSLGGLCLVNSAEPGDSQSLDWPFPDLEIFIRPTGVKLNTFEHLKNIDRSGLEELKAISQEVIASVVHKDLQSVVGKLEAFKRQLEGMNLVASHSLNLLEELKNCPGLVFSKACGAFGSDTLLFLVDKAQAQAAEEHLGVSPCKLSRSLDARGSVE